MGDFAFGSDGKADGVEVFKLNFEHPVDGVAFLDRGYLNGHFDEGFFLFSNFESNFFKILKPLVAANGEDVLVEDIKLGVAALGDDAEHEGVGVGVFVNHLFLEADGNIDLFDGAREEGGLSKADVVLVNINKL